MKKITFVLLILVVIVAFVNPASAAVYNINGTVNRSDTNVGLGGATVTNGTNTTTTSTTAPIGWFNLPNMQNSTTSLGWVLTYRAAGFVQHINYTNVSGADNFTNNVSLTPITPTQSAVSVASVSKTEATISWTDTATDNVNNNYVANRVRYSKDSALLNNVFYTSFSNNTVSPSIKLSGLELNTRYYYSADTSNIATGAYSASTTGNFITSRGNYSDNDEILSTPVKPQAAPAKKTVTTMVVPSNRNQVYFLLLMGIVAIGVVAYLYSNKTSKGKSKKKK